ncbi:choline dehydrogenase [Rhizobium sp. Root708]|uniref:GMC oxidoreductase n=1 Tax=Rhizobium sp. Root708 TaxID=1736592 RepID=UPI0006FAAE4B|nr:GMC family oxidoreductase [Rhizobium sp. Root708]KRB49286.1 choline dehydrogenase [Rhizobium sp. Root708]
MESIDLQSINHEDAVPFPNFDICIVGSGPAGSTIAKELSGTRQRVVILESGGFERTEIADALNEIENIGRVRAVDQWSVRNRIVGGSSHTWGGRCGTFDDIDFERRSWVSHSGWPIKADELAPYFDRSVDHLGLAVGSGFSGESFWKFAGKNAPTSEVDPSLLLPFFWQFSRDREESYPFEYMRFGRHLTRNLGENVTLLTSATATRVLVNENRWAHAVEIATSDGRRHVLSARTIILCAGGIENARLLLNSTSDGSKGLGNDHDQVGRYLMDHIRGPVGSFDVPGSQSLQRRFGRYNVKGHLFRAGLRLSPELQRRERLLNSAVWLGEVLAPDDPWDALRRFAGRHPNLPRDAVTLVRNTNLLLRGVSDYFGARNGFPRKLQALTLECMCEQMPDPNSRITLSARCDHLGVPLPKVDWRSHSDEDRTMWRMAEFVTEEFARIGIRTPKLAEWVRDRAPIPANFVDVAHPTGTTRMSASPTRGVVDENCEVNGTTGVFIAGSSVFPTAGHCNPTQMIVAMAIRLADHIKALAHAQAKPTAVAHA